MLDKTNKTDLRDSPLASNGQSYRERIQDTLSEAVARISEIADTLPVEEGIKAYQRMGRALARLDDVTEGVHGWRINGHLGPEHLLSSKWASIQDLTFTPSMFCQGGERRSERNYPSGRAAAGVIVIVGQGRNA